MEKTVRLFSGGFFILQKPPTGNILIFMASIWMDSEMQKYVSALKTLGDDLLPEAVATALNAPASAIEKESRRNAKKRLIIRSAYTTNSLKQDRHARGRDISRMFSRVGSNSDYLWKHDTGNTEQAKKSRIPIPTLTARGGNVRSRISRRYAMNTIGNVDGTGGKFFLGKPRGGGRNASFPVGIYERTGKNTRIKLIRNLSQSSVTIPATNFYTDAEKRYGTDEYIRNKFITTAEKLIDQKLGRLK
jgi:hypothetical protein